MTEDIWDALDVSEVQDILDGIMIKPHASLLLTNGRREDAIGLAHVLCEPKDLSKLDLPSRVRQQAERMWRRFGRNIDISVDVLPNGFIDIYGDLRHASAYAEEIVP